MPVVPIPNTGNMTFLDWAAIEVAASIVGNDDVRRGCQAEARQRGITTEEVIAERAWQGAQILYGLRPPS